MFRIGSLELSTAKLVKWLEQQAIMIGCEELLLSICDLKRRNWSFE